MKHVARQALRVDTHNRRHGVDVAHHQRDRVFGLFLKSRRALPARLRVFDNSFKPENAELPPTGGQVGLGYLTNACIGHSLIIGRRMPHPPARRALELWPG